MYKTYLISIDNKYLFVSIVLLPFLYKNYLFVLLADSVERELVKEGEKLSDMLSMPIKDALGRELSVDYTEDIVNIKDILDATNARKNIFSDSVELQKVTFEQVMHIEKYENDVMQAVKWLDELFDVLIKDHGHVGCTVYEIQSQKEDHQIFQETAKVLLFSRI